MVKTVQTRRLGEKKSSDKSATFSLYKNYSNNIPIIINKQLVITNNSILIFVFFYINY